MMLKTTEKLLKNAEASVEGYKTSNGSDPVNHNIPVVTNVIKHLQTPKQLCIKN